MSSSSTGFWLGVLSESELDAVDAYYYSKHLIYRDEGYNSQGLFGWESKAFDAHFSGCQRVLVTAAGGGREVLALRERGVEALGFECHPALVAAAQQALAHRGQPTSAIQSCARDEWPSDEHFDGAIIGWGSYSLMRGRARRVDFLRGAAASLPKGGPVLLSFFRRSGLALQHRVALAVGNSIRRLSRRVPLEPGDGLVPNFVHQFSEAQIREELAAAGFDCVHFQTSPYGHAVALRQ